MPAPGDLIHQQSVSTGTGNLTLSTVNGKRALNDEYGTGGTDKFDYYIMNQAAAEWERGTGHLSSSTTLVRDTIKASSNANAAVSFSAGTKDITNDVPAANQVRNEGSTGSDGDLVVMDGTSGRKIKGAGVGRIGPTRQIFTSSGTWNRPTGCVKIKVTGTGGGASGGGVAVTAGNAAVAGSGGGGGTFVTWIDVTATSSITVTIGAGGAAPSAGANGGNSGGATSFGTAGAYGTANGGAAGAAGVNNNLDGSGESSGSGGTTSGGDLNFAGSPGGVSVKSTSGASISGSGGGTFWGGGGAPKKSFANAGTGNAGVAYGSGGSGAAGNNAAASAAGGAGASGVVIVEEYYA